MALRNTAFIDTLTYGFEWLRLMLEAGLQEGVLNAGDMKVTAAAAGGMKVDIAAGTAFVKGDTGPPGTGLTQGLYVQVNDAAVAGAVALDAAHGSLPRIDLIVLQINDATDLGTAGSTPAFAKVTGAATSGATRDNMSGAGVVPANARLLAAVLVPAASTAVVAGNVCDRRGWARGAHVSLRRTAGTFGRQAVGFGPAESGAYPVITVELSGLHPVECIFTSWSETLTSGRSGMGVRLRNTVPDRQFIGNDGGQQATEWTHHLHEVLDGGFAAGRYAFSPELSGDGVRIQQMIADATRPQTFAVRELARQNAGNA